MMSEPHPSTWKPLAGRVECYSFSGLCEHLVCAHNKAVSSYGFDPWTAHMAMHLDNDGDHAHEDVLQGPVR